jgi:meso-butanediol dehydrogenase / (S,S)-butanediol dehydrogenase / diacetyl reductase
MDLKGQVAIITGAARGLGLLVAEGLAAKGMNIAGVDLRGPELEKEMARIASQYSVKTVAVGISIGDEKAVVTTVQRVLRDLGPIDVLVNNAGIRETAPVWKTDSAMWDRIHDSNLKGHFLFTREVLSQSMLLRGEGTLIFVSSGSGKKGEEISSAYCASKWGIIGFAESVAKDLKHTKIRVSSITPGMIETPMAYESEEWKLGLTWLNPAAVAQGIIYCIQQDPDTIIPEFRVYHRAQI